ncbi:MAG TPA: DUF2255 family protein [Candidatus Limnocylindria bacterium]|nr:DUF2255 family protein [Candidatus Limnocylindria bacterium]
MTERRFDDNTLALLDREREIRIETALPDDSVRHTTIWVVVDEGEVFVRSWRGERARWFQAAVDRPDDVAVLLAGRRLEARALSATDDESVARCSSALERKYAGDPSTRSMVREEILNTTLRLEPR